MRDGSVFSDTARNVFLVEPDCMGNESSISECPNGASMPCSSRGGVGVICQGACNSRTFLASHSYECGCLFGPCHVRWMTRGDNYWLEEMYVMNHSSN